MVVVHKYNQHLVYAIDANLCETSTTHQHYIASLDIQFMTTYPNVKYSPFFQSNANQPMPLNADWLRIGRKCQCLTNPFEMDRIGNFGL